MVLDAVAGKNRRAPVVHMDRAGNRDGALWQQQPVPLVDGDVEVIGDDVKLVAGHLEDGARIDRQESPP
jgi:hypothetical protein